MARPHNIRGSAGKGRPKGVKNKVGADVREIARKYTAEAFRALVDIVKNGDSSASRVMAARELLDRGYGKPAQTITSNSTVTVNAGAVLGGLLADISADLPAHDAGSGGEVVHPTTH